MKAHLAKDMDEQTLTRFVKDTGLPIIHTSDPAKFEKYVNIYNKLHGSLRRFVAFKAAVDELGKDEFLKARSKFIDDMKTEILAVDVVTSLKEGRIKNVKPRLNHAFNKNMYTGDETKAFASIDIRTGNFTTVKSWARRLACKGFDADTYEGLSSKHTEWSFLAQSKQIRQLIFGQCLGNSPAAEQIRMTERIAELVNKDVKRPIWRMGPDEIYFEIDRALVDAPVNMVVNDEAVNALGDDFHFRTFVVERVQGEKKHYVKKNSNGEVIDVCCVPRILYAQTFKHVFGLPLESSDLEFMHDGLLAHFANPLYAEEQNEV